MAMTCTAPGYTVLLEFWELFQKVKLFSMHPPPDLLGVRPLLVHGPQVVLVQDDGQQPGILGDVEDPDQQI
jgi:hypothetical protein